jgi:beta-lactam-binding protein with PASTA domain
MIGWVWLVAGSLGESAGGQETQAIPSSRVELVNPSDETAAVWLRAEVVEASGQRSWLPGPPESSQTPPRLILLPPRSRQLLTRSTDNGVSQASPPAPEPIVAWNVTRLRIWSETESGWTWTTYRDRDWRPVAAASESGSQTAQAATPPPTVALTLPEPPRPRRFVERLVSFRNLTEEPLRVEGMARRSREGRAEWVAWEPVTIAPGETIAARDERGLPLRASRLKVKATGPTTRFLASWERPLWLIESVPSVGRSEWAESIGRVVVAFGVRKPSPSRDAFVSGDGSTPPERVLVASVRPVTLTVRGATTLPLAARIPWNFESGGSDQLNQPDVAPHQPRQTATGSWVSLEEGRARLEFRLIGGPDGLGLIRDPEIDRLGSSGRQRRVEPLRSEGLETRARRQGNQTLWTISGPAAAILESRGEGTRSLWLATRDGRGLYRVDLPPPRLDTQLELTRYDTIRGWVLILQCQQVWPGFRIEAAWVDRPDQPGRFELVGTQPGSWLRFGDATPRGAVVWTRLVWSGPPAGASNGALRLRLVNPDGSRSRAVEWRVQDNRLLLSGREWSEAQLAPLDEPTRVPTIVGLNPIQAEREAGRAGLRLDGRDASGRRIDFTTGIERPDAWRVVAQGWPADSWARRGRALVARLEPVAGGDAQLVSGKASHAVASPTSFGEAARSVRLERLADAFGVALMAGGRTADNIAAKIENPRHAAMEIEDPAAILPDESLLEGQAEAEVWLDGPTTALRGGGARFVGVDPSLTAERVLALELALGGIDALGSVGRSAPTGLVGRAIAEAIRTHEPEFVARAGRGAGPDDLPAELVLDTVARNLGIVLSPDQRDQARLDWSRWAGSLGDGRGRAEALDLDGDGRMADDAACWAWGWLVRAGLDNPATHLRRALAATRTHGAPGVVEVVWLADRRFETAWTALSSSSAALAGGGDPLTIQGRVLGDPREVRGTLTASERLIGLSADEVAVPAVVGESAETAIRWLFNAGLNTLGHESLFRTDRIDEVRPEPGTWVRPGTAVALVGSRPAPRLVELNWREARERAVAWKLDLEPIVPQGEGVPRIEVSDRDRIRAQSPEPGRPVIAGGSLKVELARPVPNLINATLDEAINRAAQAGFAVRRAAEALGEDRVVEQQPAPGEALALGQPIQLAVQRVVPDVTGKTFAEAREILARRKLEPDPAARQWLDRPDIRVRSQSPEAGAALFLPEGSVGPASREITLTPGRRVPNLVGDRAEDARETLERLELVGRVAAGWIDDVPLKVVAQEPPEGTIVPLNASVILKLAPQGALVPDVTGMRLAQAIDTLRKAGLEAETIPGANPEEDVVVAQTPPPFGPGQPSHLPLGGRVKLDARVVVPDLSGQISLREARQRLEPLGLEPLDAQGLPDSLVVVGQSPAAGDLVPRGSKLRLELKVRVPRLERAPFEVVARWAEANRIDLDPSIRPPRDRDQVIAQSVEPGTLIALRDTVKLTLGREVPQLVGLSVAQAEEALKRLGLEFRFADVEGADGLGQPRASDKIVGPIQPSPGSLVEPGTVINLGRAVARVPQVVGLTYGEAFALLRGREGFNVAYREADDPRDGDRVTNQIPRAGESVPRGSEIKLDTRMSLPSLVGLSLDQARRKLSDLGLTVELTVDGLPSDKVLEQQPGPGAPVPPRAVVRLTPGFTPPRLIGLDLDEAERLLEQIDARGRVSQFREVFSRDPKRIGRSIVTDQTPPPDRPVRRGTPIRMSVSKYVDEEDLAAPSLVAPRPASRPDEPF